MKVAVLWSRLSGYLNACLRELASRPDVQLLVVHESAGADAPFDDAAFAWIEHRVEYRHRPDRHELLAETVRFAPDVLLISGWHIDAYRHVLRNVGRHPLRVLCMDNQWRGTLKQYIGVVASPWYVRRQFDVAFVPGERQAEFARRLGFETDRVWQGLLCPGTWHLQSEGAVTSPLPRAFGYVGRLSPEKGVQDLLDAYATYRVTASDPWDLRLAGYGPLDSAVRRTVGVSALGFVQPEDLGGFHQTIGCLVMPSRREAWGVAIAEAAAAGLPIIATDACGSVPHLVHDFANGRIAYGGGPASIAECLRYVSDASTAARREMGRISRGLVTPYTPRRWADTVLTRTEQMQASRPAPR